MVSVDRLNGSVLLARRPAPSDLRTPGSEVDLSPRQREIAKCLARGMSNTEIAVELGIAASTVKSHLASVYGKLGVSNRTQAAVVYARSGPANRHAPSALKPS